MNVKLNELIQRAQGERSQNLFASQCNISSAAITRVLRGDYIPSAKMLMKIASKAENGVSFEMLMEAAGLAISLNTEKLEQPLLPQKKNTVISIGRGGERREYEISDEDAAIVDAFLEKMRKKD